MLWSRPAPGPRSINGPVSPGSAHGLAEMSLLICRLKRSDHPTLRASSGMQSAAVDQIGTAVSKGEQREPCALFGHKGHLGLDTSSF